MVAISAGAASVECRRARNDVMYDGAEIVGSEGRPEVQVDELRKGIVWPLAAG